MLKLKRIVSVVLTLAMLLTCTAGSVYACFKTEKKPVVPQVYVTIDGGQKAITTEYAVADVKIVDLNDDEWSGSAAAGTKIKIRGNSTATGEKKPYNIKFDSKQDVLGMGGAKKWCLLANCYDPTMMRNYIAIDIAAKLGLKYTSNQQFVELWINNKYQGCYVLMEAVEVKSNRVDINLNEDGKYKNGDFLIEFDWKNEGDVTYVTDEFNNRIAIHDPEKDDVEKKNASETVKANVESKIKLLTNALKSGNWNEVKAIADVEAFAKYYILNEFMKNVDFGTSSVYYYFSGSTWHAGPAWDFDLSSGNVLSIMYPGYSNLLGDSTQGIWANKNWMAHFLKYEEFNELVAKTYEKYHYVFENTYKKGGLIDTLLKDYGTVFRDNETKAGWKASKWQSFVTKIPLPTFNQNVEFLRNWLKSRDAWLSSYWEISK